MTMSRKYFGTDGIRGEVGKSPINPEFILKLGWAVGKVLANGERKEVVIGKDTRVSGYMLESALEAGLSASGVNIRLLGPMPTPAIAYLTRTLRASVGIVISASHNLFEDNGIKFFSSKGMKLGDDIEHLIEQQLEAPLTTVHSSKLGKAARLNDGPGRYIEFCKSTLMAHARLNRLKIVVDCAHGATYHIAPNVFSELGAHVIALAVDPDGYNINANCGSTHLENLKQSVRAHGADLGIAFDGDGDRVLMVDEFGELVDGDELLFIITKYRQQQGLLEGGIVGTAMSNLGLEMALHDLKIPFLRSQVGDRYVLAKLRERSWELGGESSGHIICLDKNTTGDGIIAALQVLNAMLASQSSLHQLKKAMQKFPQVMINVKTTQAKSVIEHPKVINALEAIEAQLGRKGRVLLRASGTEPLVRVMVEGVDSSAIEQCAKQLAQTVEEVSARGVT